MRTRVHWRGVAAFVLTAYGLMWLVCLPLWLSGRGLATPGAFGLITIGMFTPALASWGVCRFVERTPWLTRVGVRSGRPADVLRYAGLGFGLATGGLVVAAALAGVAGLVAWDVIDLSGVRTYLGSLPTGAGPLPSPAVLLLLGVLGTVIATFSVNGFAALGEEVGWRGYLVPALLPLGRGPALVVSGVVWALWHSPIVLLGFNYPGSPRAGAMATFVGFCVLFGTLLAWLRLRADSAIPAAVAHAAVNGWTRFVPLLVAAGAPAPGLIGSPVGVICYLPFGALAAVLLIRARWETGRSSVPGSAAPNVRST